jgi:hypothetical protein
VPSALHLLRCVALLTQQSSHKKTLLWASLPLAASLAAMLAQSITAVPHLFLTPLCCSPPNSFLSSIRCSHSPHGRGTAGGGEWRGHAGGGGWRLLSSALVRGDGSQKNRSSRLAWRGCLAALSVAIECSEALPVRTLVDLIYFSTCWTRTF